MRERSCEAPMVAIWRWKRSTTGATAVIGGRGESGEVEWRRWLQRGTEQRRREGAAEKEEVREAKVLEGEGEGKKSLGLVALRSEETVVIYMLVTISDHAFGGRKDKDGWWRFCFVASFAATTTIERWKGV